MGSMSDATVSVRQTIALQSNANASDSDPIEPDSGGERCARAPEPIHRALLRLPCVGQRINRVVKRRGRDRERTNQDTSRFAGIR